MKVALLGDTHWGARSDSSYFQDYFVEFFNTIFFPYLKENDIKTVIQLGDLFDRRKYINFNTLNVMRTHFMSQFNENTGIQLIVFPGNHDTYSKNTNRINSVNELIYESDYVKVITTPSTVDIDGLSMDIIPWINSENNDDTFDFIARSMSRFCCGHFEFSGFQMQQGIESTHGMSYDRFSKYDTVFSGHYHTHSKKDNIIYVGTPYEMSWSDYQDMKGFYVLDTDTLKTERVISPLSMYHKITYNDSYDISTPIEQYRGKVVKVIINSRCDQDRMSQFIDSLYTVTPADVTVIDTAFGYDAEVLKDSTSIRVDDPITTIKKYIDSNDDISVNKNILKQLATAIYQESIDLCNSSAE